LNSLITSFSSFSYGFSPMRGWISLYLTKASSEGVFVRGFSLSKRMKEVEGCFKAAVRNAWSVRRKETRFSGDPYGLSI
jgi:hypothetical protein